MAVAAGKGNYMKKTEGKPLPLGVSGEGEKINFYFDPERIHLFDKDTEENLFYREEMR